MPRPERPIVVAGAGAAGLACALAAAGAGASVWLLERARGVGGTVVRSLIHTLGGLLDDQGASVNPGLPAELIDRLRDADPHTARRRMGRTWVLGVAPGIYRRVVDGWLDELPSIHRLVDAQVTDIATDGACVTAVTVRDGARLHALEARALVDATGEADLVRRLDATLLEPGAALAGLVVVLRGVAPQALAFPKGVALVKAIRVAAGAGRLPPECATLWSDSGVYPDEVYLKLNLPSGDYDPGHMDAVVERLLAWLRRRPGFAGAHVAARGALGVRDGGRIRGRYRLREADLMAGRRFPDAVCRGCWPIEHWHPEQGIRLDYLPPGTHYDIPLRALQVQGLANLYAAGKCLSAEPRAQASARVVGTCWGMGAGLGQALAARATMEAHDDAVRAHA